MARVDYGMLDAFGRTIGLCAETLALAELGRPAAAVAKATACYDVVDTSPRSSFLGQPLAEFHTFALQVCGMSASRSKRPRPICDAAGNGPRRVRTHGLRALNHQGYSTIHPQAQPARP